MAYRIYTSGTPFCARGQRSKRLYAGIWRLPRGSIPSLETGDLTREKGYANSSRTPIRINKTAENGVRTEKNLQRRNFCPKITLTWMLRQEKSIEKNPTHMGERDITPALSEGGIQFTASTKPRISTSVNLGVSWSSGVSFFCVMLW